MPKARQRVRAVRGTAVPTSPIVATDPVAVGPTVTHEAPAFPGVDEAALPIYDALVAGSYQHLALQDAAAAAMAAEPFPSWGLEDVAPVPLTFMIAELRKKVDPGTAWTIEESVRAQALLDKITVLGEVTSDDDTDGEPAGDAEGADPGAAAVVAGDGRDDHGAAPQG